MKKTKLPYYEIFSLAIGEAIISVIICLVYFAVGKFNYTVITGVSLGSLVTVLNFIYLSVTTTRAIDTFLALKGNREMGEEESAAFAQENQAIVQNKIKLSYLLRTFTMLATLIVAFLVEYFDVIATLIPLLAFRLVTMAAALIKRKVIKE